VRKQREQGRRARQRADVLTVALVGYTNAGTSTLFNAMTQAHVLAEDRLFATLDPTLRKLDITAWVTSCWRHRRFHPASAAQPGRSVQSDAGRGSRRPICSFT
jgi:hypothetical protein